MWPPPLTTSRKLKCKIDRAEQESAVSFHCASDGLVSAANKLTPKTNESHYEKRKQNVARLGCFKLPFGGKSRCGSRDLPFKPPRRHTFQQLAANCQRKPPEPAHTHAVNAKRCAVKRCSFSEMKGLVSTIITSQPGRYVRWFVVT